MRSTSHLRLLAALVAICAASACQVAPPAFSARAEHGIVRAADEATARDVARALDRVAPRVFDLLPGARHEEVEIWVQDEPALWAFARSAYSDADGFWAEGVGRIHLRTGAERLERTLAHELVHQCAGEMFEELPGTLEEGLCDLVASLACPESAARLRAGRLSSAAFATGGLVLDLELALEGAGEGDPREPCWTARLRIDADPPVRVEPCDVFSVAAGLSSTPLSSGEKKSFYGLAFLVIDRVVAAEGLAGVRNRCARARARGEREVRASEWLAAAGLTADVESWRDAVALAIGPRELEELVRAHPEMLVRTLAQYVAPYRGDPAFEQVLDRLRARLSIAGAEHAGCELDALTALRPRLERAFGHEALARR